MPADVQKVRALFLHAVGKLPPEQWDGYVAEACGEDAELGRQVGRLLQVHREAGSFLDRPAAALEVTAAFTPAGDAAAAVPLRERPGTVIGPYKLLQQIGEGGMGAVFMAEQTHPVRRMVALKVIKAGMDSRQVIARFEAERQALAMMDHINIARVLDAGATESGLPYFVMELVHGVPITKYCDDNHLTPRERLELFVPVCQAIQHAHQKGVIHRDVKPSNVMITLYDGKPVPKVIDFGVAKAIDQRLTEGTLFTQYGAMVGTLEYMSPEQAEMSALGVDTRSDVYSLGVLLYELLTGGTPLSHKRIREAAYGEVLRMIKEEEPPRPSTRLNDSGEALVTISAQRHMEPAKLAKLVRGELDWIVMKTLEKDRNRRYATASGFAADVQRYLNDEPVQAYPPTAGYRFRKFARRNKRILATVGLLALALTTGTVVSAWQAIRATEAEGLAQTRLQAETEAQHATRAQLLLTEEAQEKATRGLYEARVAQAQAIRLGGRIGQRFQSLDILTDATQMARYMNLFEDDSLKLRNEAIGCLALPDIGLAKEWPGWPEGSRGLAFDGALERYARLDQQGIVSIRRVADDAELWSLPGMGPDAASNLSPDGQFFALHHPDNRFQVWKLAGKEPVELLNGTGIFAFSPDSRQCASSRADGSLWLYELPSGRLVKQLALGVQASSLAFHPRDEQLALSCEKGVQVRDLRTGDILAEFPCNNAEQLAWHPDGETLAVLVAPERTIHICERATLKTIIRLEGSRNDGIRFAFNRTGDVLASICWDARLRLWDPRTGLELFSTAGLSLTSLRFSSDKDLMAAGVVGDKLQLWKVGSAPCYRTLLRNNALGAGYYHTVAIHPNGRLLAVGMGDGADLWDLATGKHLQWIKLAPGTNHVLFDPFGALLTNGPDGVLRWPVQVGIPTAELVRVGPPQKLALPGSDCKIARSKDGRVIATAQHNMGSWILHPDGSDQPIRLGPTNVDVRYVAVSPDGRLVAAASHVGAPVQVWRLDSSKPESGKLEAELPGIAFMVGFSPDGKWLATSMPDCCLWAVDSWQPGPHIGAGTALAFSPDGKLLALETSQGVVRLVDPETGREYARLEDPNRLQDRAKEMSFSPDGTQLVMTNDDSQSIHVWDLRAIRERLAKMGLDWRLPPYPPAPEAKVLQPLEIQVELDDPAPSKQDGK